MSRRASRRAPRHARRDPDATPEGESGRPVAPGAWGARSRAQAAPEPVVWPEAGSADVPPAPPAPRRVTPPPPSPSDRLSDPAATDHRPGAATGWPSAGDEPPRAAASRPGAQGGPPRTVRRRAGAAPVGGSASPPAAPAGGAVPTGSRGPVGAGAAGRPSAAGGRADGDWPPRVGGGAGAASGEPAAGSARNWAGGPVPADAAAQSRVSARRSGPGAAAPGQAHDAAARPGVAARGADGSAPSHSVGGDERSPGGPAAGSVPGWTDGPVSADAAARPGAFAGMADGSAPARGGRGAGAPSGAPAPGPAGPAARSAPQAAVRLSAPGAPGGGAVPAGGPGPDVAARRGAAGSADGNGSAPAGGRAEVSPTGGATAEGGVGSPPGERPRGTNVPAAAEAGRPAEAAGETARPAARAGGTPRGAPEAPAAGRGRRGSADPVRGLMRRHRELCEQAVDPLEIAAGLEAHGVTDRTAARFRHRDVFSLAEELFVRVPRAEPAAAPAPAPSPTVPPTGRRRVARAVAPVLPGVLCAAALVALAVTPPTAAPAVRLGVAVAGAAAVLAAVRFAVRGLPRTRTAVLWACWLFAYAVLGDGALTGLLADGRPAGAVQPDLSVTLTLAWAVAPAIWCGRWFARRARSRLPASRSLGDFASGVRPLFAAAVALFVLALAVLHTAVRLAGETVPLPGAPDGPAFALPGELPRALTAALTGGQSGWQLGATSAAEAALGVLLFTAALLVVHGAPGAASAGLGAACAVEAAALGTVLVARLPGLGVLSRPVEYAVAVAGPAAVPALACTAAAVGLLVQAVRVLAGASAHQGPEGW